MRSVSRFARSWGWMAAILLCVGCVGKPRVSYKELADDDPQVRADAAMRLGQTRAPDAIDSLVAVLNDSDEVVRVNAVRSLGQIGDKRAVPAVLPLLTDTLSTVRLAACSTLGTLADPSAVPALTKGLYTADETERLCSARSLGVIPGPEALDALIKVALQDEDETVRQHVVKVIGERRVREAIPKLESALAAESERVRSNAARVLGEIGDASCVPVLVRALDDPYFKVRSLSAHALIALAPNDAEVKAALRKRLESETHGMVAVDLGWSLAKVGDRSGLERIRDLLFKGDPEDVRAEAAMALGDIGDDTDVPRLAKATYDKKGLVAREAAKSLQKLKKN